MKRIRYSLLFLSVSLLFVSTGEMAIGETESIRDAREKSKTRLIGALMLLLY